MPINFPQPLASQNNISRRIEIDNTYSLRNIRVGSENPPQAANEDFRNAINTRQNMSLKAEISEINQPTSKVSNVIKREDLQNRVNRLEQSANATESSQVKDIEDLNANIAQGIKPAGTGTRLVNNFFSNARRGKNFQ